MAAAKEAIILLLDVGANMQQPANTNGDSCYSLMLQCVEWIVCRKIFAKAKDEIGVICFGSNETNNPLNDDNPDQYKNINLLREVQLCDLNLLKAVSRDNIQITENSGDFLSALTVGIYCMREALEGRKFGGMQIVLLSNLGGTVVDDRFGRICNQMVEMGIEFHVFGSCVHDEDDENEDGENNDDPEQPGTSAASAVSNQRAALNALLRAKQTGRMHKGEQILTRMKATQNLSLVRMHIDTAITDLSRFERRATRTTAWKCPLTITEQFKIPILMYLKTRHNKNLDSWKRIDTTDAHGSNITINRRYELLTGMQPDQDEIVKDDVIDGQRFGSSKVPINATNKDALKYKSDSKAFDILGFQDMAKVKRHFFMGDGAHFVFPDPADETACVGMSALHQALHNTQSVAIVRYLYNRASQPRLGALFPKTNRQATVNQEKPCLVFVRLPYEDDMRNFAFAPFPQTTQPTAEQQSAMDALVDSLQLIHQVGPDQISDSLSISEVSNPLMQHTLYCLKERALQGDQPQPLPQIAEALLAPLSPNPQLFDTEHTKKVLESIKTNFKLKPKEPKVKHGKRKTDRDDNVADDVDEEGENGVKRARNESGEAAQTNGVDAANQILIGTTDPVKDFNTFVLTNPDRVIDAIGLMSERIREFIQLCVADSLYVKIMDCLEALRAACLQYAQATKYNMQMFTIKEDLTALRHHELWQKIDNGKLGFICKSENDSADMSEADVLELMAVDDMKPALQQPSDDMKQEDLLDELE